MSKQKKKNIVKPKSKIFQIIVVIIILMFLALILSDLFNTKQAHKQTSDSVTPNENYKFTKNGELTFQSEEGEFISSIEIEFADNDYKRQQGLMYRTEMGENQGMLFIFPYEAMQSFWMKNTILALDMFYVNSNLIIVTIQKNTEPYATKSYPSTAPALYVLGLCCF